MSGRLVLGIAGVLALGGAVHGFEKEVELDPGAEALFRIECAKVNGFWLLPDAPTRNLKGDDLTVYCPDGPGDTSPLSATVRVDLF